MSKEPAIYGVILGDHHRDYNHLLKETGLERKQLRELRREEDVWGIKFTKIFTYGAWYTNLQQGRLRERLEREGYTIEPFIKQLWDKQKEAENGK